MSLWMTRLENSATTEFQTALKEKKKKVALNLHVILSFPITLYKRTSKVLIKFKHDSLLDI